MDPSTSVWLLSWTGCTEYIRCGSSCVPAVSPQLGCRRYPSAVVALFTYVCSSYACARCAGWGAAASFAQFMASSVSPGAAAPPLLTSLTNSLSCGALMGFYAWVGYLSYVIPVASALVAQWVPAQVLVVALRSVARMVNFSPNPQFSR